MPDDLLPDLVALVRAETADSLVLRALAMADELERTRADLRAARDALGAAPIIAGPSAVALAEGATSLGTWASSKPGTWSASGPDAGLITVPPGPSAACSPAFAAAPNFEAPSDAGADRTYDFTLRCTDGAGTVGTLAVAATITNVPEVMLGALALSSSTMAETASAGTAVGAVLGLAAGGAWSLADDAGGRFARSGTTLVLGATALDWETAPVIGVGPARGYPVTLRETHPDAEGGSRDTTLMIQVTNVPEVTLAPLTLSASAVAENVAPGTVVARVQGLTAGGSWTLSNTAGGRLSRSGTSILAEATPIDFETGPSLAWAITETHPDAASPRVTSGTIAVTDVAEAPPSLSSLRISSYLLDAGAGSTTQAVADATGAVPLTRGPTSAVEVADPAWTAQGMHFAGGRILRSDPAASTAAYGGVTNLTLLAVVRRRTATFGGYNYQFIAGRDNNPADFALALTSGALRGVSGRGTGADITDPGGALPLMEWVVVGLRRTATEFALWRNGVKAASAPIALGSSNPPGFFSVGSLPHAVAEGDLRDVDVACVGTWRDLSEAQVLEATEALRAIARAAPKSIAFRGDAAGATAVAFAQAEVMEDDAPGTLVGVLA